MHHEYFVNSHVKKYVNDVEAPRSYQYLCELNNNYPILRLKLQYVTGGTSQTDLIIYNNYNNYARITFWRLNIPNNERLRVICIILVVSNIYRKAFEIIVIYGMYRKSWYKRNGGDTSCSYTNRKCRLNFFQTRDFVFEKIVFEDPRFTRFTSCIFEAWIFINVSQFE